MSDNYRQDHRRLQNRFNYSTQVQNSKELNLNLHHKYFKLYQQFTSSGTHHQSFQQKEKQQQEKCNSLHEEYRDKQRTIVKQLQLQNKCLKQQIKDHQEIIRTLKSQLNITNLQLEKISKINKIQSYQYQNALKDLHEEISIILQRNRNCDQQNKTLKQIIKEMNQTQIKSQYQLSQIRLYSRSKSLGRPFSQCSYNDKENQLDSNRQNHSKNEKQVQSNRKFINGLKEMYCKITNLHIVSLKQLWRWLKDIGQMLHRLRKWRKTCRQSMKQSDGKNYQRIIDFINEAMIIIN